MERREQPDLQCNEEMCNFEEVKQSAYTCPPEDEFQVVFNTELEFDPPTKEQLKWKKGFETFKKSLPKGGNLARFLGGQQEYLEDKTRLFKQIQDEVVKCPLYKQQSGFISDNLEQVIQAKTNWFIRYPDIIDCMTKTATEIVFFDINENYSTGFPEVKAYYHSVKADLMDFYQHCIRGRLCQYIYHDKVIRHLFELDFSQPLMVIVRKMVKIVNLLDKKQEKPSNGIFGIMNNGGNDNNRQLFGMYAHEPMEGYRPIYNPEMIKRYKSVEQAQLDNYIRRYNYLKILLMVDTYEDRFINDYLYDKNGQRIYDLFRQILKKRFNVSESLLKRFENFRKNPQLCVFEWNDQAPRRASQIIRELQKNFCYQVYFNFGQPDQVVKVTPLRENTVTAYSVSGPGGTFVKQGLDEEEVEGWTLDKQKKYLNMLAKNSHTQLIQQQLISAMIKQDIQQLDKEDFYTFSKVLLQKQKLEQEFGHGIFREQNTEVEMAVRLNLMDLPIHYCPCVYHNMVGNYWTSSFFLDLQNLYYDLMLFQSGNLSVGEVFLLSGLTFRMSILGCGQFTTNAGHFKITDNIFDSVYQYDEQRCKWVRRRK